MSRRVIAALGVLAFAVSACSSSEPTRPVAKPGEIVTVLRGEPGHERALADWYSVALDKDGTLYAAELSDARGVKIPKSGHPSMIVDESTRFPPPPHPLPTGLSPLVYERMSITGRDDATAREASTQQNRFGGRLSVHSAVRVWQTLAVVVGADVSALRPAVDISFLDARAGREPSIAFALAAGIRYSR